MKKLTFKKPSMKSLRLILPIAFVLILIASVVLVQTVDLPKKTDGGAKPVSTADYQKSLKAQVDNADGSPASGRDPSTQSQTTLASAAATPSGTGTRTSTPASGLTGSTGSSVSPDQVYGTTAEQRAKGVNSAGCFYDYGVPGQECMPASMANAKGELECSMVRMHYPTGIKVSGTDRFHLDTNGDKIACGSGDN